MPNKKNIEGQGFHTHPERINRKGRPRRLFSEMAKELKEQGYESVTPTRLVEAYEMLLALPADKLKGIMQDDDQPIIFKVLIKALTGSKGIEVIEKMLDRAHGKPKQTNYIGGVEDEPPIQIVIRGEKPERNNSNT